MAPARAHREEVRSGPSLGLAARRRTPTFMRYAHQHTDIELNFVFRGRLEYFIDGRFLVLPNERLLIFWAGMPHRASSVTPETDYVWITVPLAWFLSFGIGGSFSQRLLRGELLQEPAADPGQAAQDRTLVARWARELEAPNPEQRKIVMLEVEARVRRLGADLNRALPPAKERSRRPSGGTHKAEQMATYIGKQYRTELPISRIAADAGLHPHYAMQLFKKACGMSLKEYLVRMRISHAQRLLLTTDQKVLEVALESGFHSASRFYATFQRISGCSPRTYRETKT